ncbi:hypothetical protein CSPAE12_03261 [Colletotrichum incanum]|nr:hypothetical protein CSPAE12_03261 [Colletotrichum incanum]
MDLAHRITLVRLKAIL